MLKQWMSRLAPEATPTSTVEHLTDATTWLPAGYELITREDIYSRGMLVMKEGTIVSMQMLPKLMRYGAQPQQFILRELPNHATAAGTGITNPIQPRHQAPIGMSLPDTLNADPILGSMSAAESDYDLSDDRMTLGQDCRPDIVIVEPNNRDLRKLMDTLTMSGVRLAHLHCTPVGENLIPWVRKFKPSVLILDESIHPLTSLVPKLNALKRTFQIEHIVLSVSRTAPNSDDGLILNREKLLATIAASGVEVLPKPLNRLSLAKTVARYKAKTQVNNQLEQLASEI